MADDARHLSRLGRKAAGERAGFGCSVEESFQATEGLRTVCKSDLENGLGPPKPVGPIMEGEISSNNRREAVLRLSVCVRIGAGIHRRDRGNLERGIINQKPILNQADGPGRHVVHRERRIVIYPIRFIPRVRPEARVSDHVRLPVLQDDFKTRAGSGGRGFCLVAPRGIIDQEYEAGSNGKKNQRN